MAITPQESTNWTATGAKDAMAKTYAAVEKALSESPELAARNIETFLQGSYANSTNIRGDADVDVVVMLKSSWTPDKSLLTSEQRAAYDKDHSPASYTAAHLRKDVILALQKYFGPERVEARKKAVRVHKIDGYVDADVVPALQHRVYVDYDSVTKGRFLEGTKLFPSEGPSITNYPKVHKLNGTAKNKATNENFKPTVRQLKQLKRRAINSGKLDAKLAPGYLLECMVFNAPDTIFSDDHHGRLLNVMGWLLSADFTQFMSVDKIHKLFKTDPGKFSSSDAKDITVKLAEEMTA